MPMIIQLIGWLGMAAFLVSYQMKSNRILFVMQAVGAGLFCLQFCLMHAYSGCFSLLLILLRSLLLRKYREWKWVRWYGWCFIFVLAFLAVLILTWTGPVSLLAFAASVVSTFFYWTNNAGKIRLSNLCVASPCWIVYDILVGSWGGMTSEIITMVSIIISIIRFGWKNLMEDNS